MSNLLEKSLAEKVIARPSSKELASNYSRFFEAGRDASVIGDYDAQVAHGLVPSTSEERAAWDAGRASMRLNTLM